MSLRCATNNVNKKKYIFLIKIDTQRKTIYINEYFDMVNISSIQSRCGRWILEHIKEIVLEKVIAMLVVLAAADGKGVE